LNIATSRVGSIEQALVRARDARVLRVRALFARALYVLARVASCLACAISE
jgi:hypothetical protein